MCTHLFIVFSYIKINSSCVNGLLYGLIFFYNILFYIYKCLFTRIQYLFHELGLLILDFFKKKLN